MKRFLVVVLVIGSLSTWVSADDNVRAAQAKLKEGGFYFKQVDGSPSSDFSAAVTRYQIRNGLQITGELNAETSKSLGLNTEASSSAARPTGPTVETWRQLRKDEQPSRESVPARRTTAREQSDENVAGEAPAAVLEPAGDDPSRKVLSPERLRDYIAAFVLAGIAPKVGSELEFFGERVRYYEQGTIDRARIQRDLERYAARWPERKFWLAGDPKVQIQPDSRIQVSFPLRYELRQGSKRSAGTVRKTLLLEIVGDDLQIVAVDEKKA